MSNNLDIDIMKLTLPNGRTLEKQMKYEAKRFLKIFAMVSLNIQNLIDKMI